MPRLNLFRFPAKLRRRVRRNRMATLLFLLALLLLVLLPFYAVWCAYKPPAYLIRYFRTRYPDVLFDIPTDEKIIALSIDDAPSGYTDEIAEILAQNDAHATFFVIGGQVKGREQVLRRMVRAGHELGNHAMRDEPSKDLSSEELKKQIYEVQRMLKSAYEAEGKTLTNNYFRPGSGFFNTRMRELLSEWGFRITLGSVYPHDPQIPYPSVNARHVLSMAHPGAIIICHDRRPWTAPMLRIVLPELRRRGYRIVTISDLLASTTQTVQ
ncbi:polysaccharide deacetylase domain-containing protein [Sarocladium implicatum]|nr:polysaccharide deacetylase domain-containing protein [Sarocladium implicatum]